MLIRANCWLVKAREETPIDFEVKTFRSDLYTMSHHPVATLDDVMMRVNHCIVWTLLDFSLFAGFLKQREETAIDYEVKTFRI